MTLQVTTQFGTSLGLLPLCRISFLPSSVNRRNGTFHCPTSKLDNHLDAGRRRAGEEYREVFRKCMTFSDCTVPAVEKKEQLDSTLMLARIPCTIYLPFQHYPSNYRGKRSQRIVRPNTVQQCWAARLLHESTQDNGAKSIVHC
jgi:hypothetical protein